MFANLKKLWNEKRSCSIISLFDDLNRPAEFSIELDELFFDYSKTQIDKETRVELLKLAKLREVERVRSAMFLSLIHI